LLHSIKAPVVLAIDTVHHLMDYPHIASHFFSMLRSWYEKARVRAEWQNLRLIMTYVNELDLPLPLHQSPFNVGLRLQVPSLTLQQVVDLTNRDIYHHLGVNEAAQLAPLFALIEGQPYLWQLALYWLRSGELSLTPLIEQAPTNQGIYYDYLRYVKIKLQRDATLIEAVQRMLAAAEPIALEESVTERLHELGLTRLDGPKATFACDLYRQYFATYLAERYV
jgi:hypothetical protein